MSSKSAATQEEIDLLSADEVQIYVEDAPKKNPEHTNALTRQLRSTSRTISIACSLVVIMSIACMIILGVIIIVSKTLGNDKKIFVGTIMGVLLVGIQVVLCVSRKDPNTLIIFGCIGAFVSGLCLGLSVWYF